MNNSKKTSQKVAEKDEGQTLIGKRHDDSKPDADKKNVRETKNERARTEEPEKKIEIDDNPGETERKIPRMKHS